MMPARTAQWTTAKKAEFLRSYAELGTVTHAAIHADIDRGAHYDWMQNDPEYPARFAAACTEAVEKLEREVIRRGAEGVEKPVYQGGKLVGTVREYSDTLLIFALKGLRPEKYRERVSIITEDALDAEIARLAEQLGSAAQTGEAAGATTTQG